MSTGSLGVGAVLSSSYCTLCLFLATVMTEVFEKAAEEAKRLRQTPNKGEIAQLYGLFKQATLGEVKTERPGFLDFTGRAKWDAWNSKRELTKEQAMAAYVDLVVELKEKYGLEEEKES